MKKVFMLMAAVAVVFAVAACGNNSQKAAQNTETEVTETVVEEHCGNCEEATSECEEAATECAETHTCTEENCTESAE